MDDESLRTDEYVTLIKVASVHVLAATISASADVKLQLSIVSQLMIAVERTCEHRT